MLQTSWTNVTTSGKVCTFSVYYVYERRVQVIHTRHVYCTVHLLVCLNHLGVTIYEFFHCMSLNLISFAFKHHTFSMHVCFLSLYLFAVLFNSSWFYSLDVNEVCRLSLYERLHSIKLALPHFQHQRVICQAGLEAYVSCAYMATLSTYTSCCYFIVVQAGSHEDAASKR